jgi:hypothetical protein
MKSTAASILVLSMVVLTGCKSISLTMPTPSRDATSMVPPVVEKRETITATGYAVVTVQNHKNPAQQRLMAIRASKLDAYRNLTEQVYGQQLDATWSSPMTLSAQRLRALFMAPDWSASPLSARILMKQLCL